MVSVKKLNIESFYRDLSVPDGAIEVCKAADVLHVARDPWKGYFHSPKSKHGLSSYNLAHLGLVEIIVADFPREVCTKGPRMEKSIEYGSVRLAIDRISRM